MKKISKIRLNQISDSTMQKSDLRHVLGGGSCTNYSCQCNGDGMAGNSNFVDSHLDGQASLGNI